jgi:hypothetical protein
MGMYVAMAIPLLETEDKQYIEKKLDLPLQFLEVGQSAQ